MSRADFVNTGERAIERVLAENGLHSSPPKVAPRWLVIVGIGGLIILAGFALFRYEVNAKLQISGYQQLSEEIRGQRETIEAQNFIIRDQSKKIVSLDSMVRKQTETIKRQKYELDSVQHIVGYMQRHYIPKAAFKEYIDANRTISPLEKRYKSRDGSEP